MPRHIRHERGRYMTFAGAPEGYYYSSIRQVPRIKQHPSKGHGMNFDKETAKPGKLQVSQFGPTLIHKGRKP